MYDILPTPQELFNGSQEEQIKNLYNYLFQLKETLEFVLTDIGIDNLSADLRKRLDKLSNVPSNVQVASKGASVEDVINSQEFKNEEARIVARSRVTLNVNYQTGNLEYNYPT